MDNYLPISCLPSLWKLLTGIISEHLYCFLEEERIIYEEQKGCKRNSRGTSLETAKGKIQIWQCLG